MRKIERRAFLTASYSAFLVGFLWVTGLYYSYVQTRHTATEFYQWAYPDYSHPYDIFNTFAEEPSETASEFIARFENSNQPFKRYLKLTDTEDLSKIPPSLPMTWAFGSSINGSTFFMGSSFSSTYYSARIRAAKETDEKTSSTITVLVERSLFGL